MALTLPNLQPGRVYRRCEIEQFVGHQHGTSDFDIANAQFPRDLTTWEADLQLWRAGDEVLVQYQVFPIDRFKRLILELESTFNQHHDHLQRVAAIKQVILKGDVVFPVFLQQNDSQHRLIEGMHRAVALFRLGSPALPAFLTGYSDWFK